MGIVKKYVISFFIILVLMIILLYFWHIRFTHSVENANVKQSKECENIRLQVDSIFMVSKAYLAKYEFDSALQMLTKIDNSEYKCHNKPQIYDSVQTLKKQIINFKSSLSQSFDIATVRDMANEEYELLCDKRLDKNYFEPDPINKYFINLLYNIRNNRAQYKAEEKNRIAKIDKDRLAKEREIRQAEAAKARELRLAGAAIRKAYQNELRTNFLDIGLDIDVRVVGKDNTQLILTFALFNDVWFRKFETTGNFDTWHKLGFDRIDIKDNYDYHRYLHWK